jgi:hypothetical protein
MPPQLSAQQIPRLQVLSIFRISQRRDTAPRSSSPPFFLRDEEPHLLRNHIRRHKPKGVFLVRLCLSVFLRDRAGILTALRSRCHPERSKRGAPGLVSWLPASFRPRLARAEEQAPDRRPRGTASVLSALGFANPPSGGVEDFDLPAVGNARHRAKRGSSRCPAPN